MEKNGKFAFILAQSIETNINVMDAPYLLLKAFFSSQ